MAKKLRPDAEYRNCCSFGIFHHIKLEPVTFVLKLNDEES